MTNLFQLQLLEHRLNANLTASSHVYVAVRFMTHVIKIWYYVKVKYISLLHIIISYNKFIVAPGGLYMFVNCGWRFDSFGIFNMASAILNKEDI